MRKLFVAVAVVACLGSAAGLGAAEIRIASAADNVGPVGTYQLVSPGLTSAWIIDTRSGQIRYCVAATAAYPQEGSTQPLSCTGFIR